MADSLAMAVDAPADADSYALYLRANQIASDRKMESVALARDLYLTCVRMDPNYAPAWARLGRCYRTLGKFHAGATPRDDSALKAIERAFALNPDLGVAHNVCTPIQADAGQAESAMVRLLERAASHDNDPELFCGLVHACRYCGLLEASLAAHCRGVWLDPNLRTSVAHTYFAMGEYEQALDSYGPTNGIYLDALALAAMGREQEACGLMRTRRSIFSTMPAQMHTLDAYLLHEPERAQAVLRAEMDADFRDPELRFYLARQAARLGAIDAAHELLKRSVEEGYWIPETMMQDPWLAPLHTSSAFQAIYKLAVQRAAQSKAAFVDAGGQRVLGEEALR